MGIALLCRLEITKKREVGKGGEKVRRRLRKSKARGGKEREMVKEIGDRDTGRTEENGEKPSRKREKKKK